MDLTLNDFRNILGKVNDGDAVFTKDNNGNTTGIEKANYGRLRTHNVKGVTVDDSVMIRRSSWRPFAAPPASTTRWSAKTR